MSATLVSSNTTIKVNGGSVGTIFNPAGATSVTITAAANEYILLSATFGSAAAGNGIEIGGTLHAQTVSQSQSYYVPPSSSVVLRASAGNAAGYAFTRFINTP
jgi:hypothetical protein